MPIALILVILLASIPSLVGHVKVEGWPDLEVKEHIVSTKQMGDACAGQAYSGCIVLGCSVYDFNKKTCDIWVSEENPSYPNILEHEKLHCQGYDHWWTPPGCGTTAMADELKAWKEHKESR